MNCYSTTTHRNIKVSFHDSVNLFVLFFCVKKSIFGQLTPVLSTVRYTKVYILYLNYCSDILQIDFRLFLSLLHGGFIMKDE